jgi:hypothetical protein
MIRNKIRINFGNHVIENQPQAKIIDVIFDHKASWIPHILNLKKSISSRLRIIKTLAHTSWGAQSQALSKIHKTFIRTKFDYGASLSFLNRQKFKNSAPNSQCRMPLLHQRLPLESHQNHSNLPS